MSRVLILGLKLTVGFCSLVLLDDLRPAIASGVSLTAKPVVLQGAKPVRDLQGSIEYLLDPTHELTIEQILQPAIGAAFKLFPGTEPEFGYSPDKIWLRFRLINKSNAADRWKLHFHLNFLHGADIYVVRAGGKTDHVLAQGLDTPFQSRTVLYHKLVANLDLAKDEIVHVYVRYWSQGFTGLPLTIETQNSFDALAAVSVPKTFLFQGFMLLFVFLGLVTFFVTGSFTPLAYALFILSGTLFLFHRDGFAFQFLWPFAPGFNAFASLPLGSALVVCGSIYVRSFLRTRWMHPVFDKILLANIFLGAGLLLAAVVVDVQVLKKTMIMAASFSTLIFFAAGLNTARTRFKEVRFFILGGIGVIVAAAFVSGRSLLGIEISLDTALDAMRISIVYDALMMGLALIDRYLQVRREQRLVLEENLAAAQRNLDMHKRLDRLEQRYALAREVAQSRGRRLSDATHDLREPIHALHLTIQQLINSGSVEGRLGETISRNFDYLEKLVENTLAESAAEEEAGVGHESIPAATPSSGDGSAQTPETFPVQLVLQNAFEMFADEAKGKGLLLKYLPCSVSVQADPLSLLRIVSNLVANAVKYTGEGRVLLGCRRRSGLLSVEVHDTGPGMSAAEVARVMERSQRSAPGKDQSAGFGFGLSIVNDLARQGGLNVRCHSQPSRGTRFVVEVPRHWPADPEPALAVSESRSPDP